MKIEFDAPAKLMLFLTGLLLLMTLLMMSGCAGLRQTAKEPVHAETGAGITVWKIPVLGFDEWGNYGGQAPQVIVYKYDYRAKPPALSPGTMPLPGPPPLADYQTVYDSSFDDPSLVIFKNDSYRKVRIWIDKGKQPIILEPYGATSDLHLGVGEHLVRVAIEKPTAVHGIWTVNQEFTVYVHPEGEAQIFHIYESGY